MNKRNQEIFAKIGNICGFVCIICGIIITVVCALEIDSKPYLRLASGIFFIVVGVLYLIFNPNKQNK